MGGDQCGVLVVWARFWAVRARPRWSAGPGLPLRSSGSRLCRFLTPRTYSPFSPLREVHDSGRVWGKKRALLYLEAISHCVFPRVAEIGALSGRSSDRQEKVVVPSTTPTHPLSFLESLPKIKSKISSALSKCLPSFDLAGRPLSLSPHP